jgi:fermentation-respiration switch protein FrsA (DUF1100 family)
MLGRRDHEQRVRQRAAASGAPRRRSHGGRVRVDADDERVRALGRRGQHVPAVTGAEVDRNAGVSRGEASEVAGAELLNLAPSDHPDHAPSLARALTCDSLPEGGFRMPILLFHSTDDHRVPISSSAAFARALPELVTYHRVAGAGHVESWNVGPARYERRARTFLARVLG